MGKHGQLLISPNDGLPKTHDMRFNNDGTKMFLLMFDANASSNIMEFNLVHLIFNLAQQR